MEEVDDVGRRAATALVAEVAQRIDVEEALRQLYEGRATTLITLDQDDPKRPARRHAWQATAVGIAAAVAVVAGILVVRHDRSPRVAPVDSAVTTPAPTVITSAGPPPSTAASTSSTAPPVAVPETATVTVDGTTPTLIGDVVFSTNATTPWVGAVTPSGRLFVGFGEGPATPVSEVVDGHLVPTGITTNGMLRSALDERLYDIDWTANQLVVWAEQADGTWAVDVTDGPVNDCAFVAQPDEVRCGDVTVAVTPPAPASHVEWVGGSWVGSARDGVSASWTIELDGDELSLDDCVDSGCEQYLRVGYLGIAWTPQLTSAARPNAHLVSLLQPGQPAATAWLECPGAPCQIIGADSSAIYTLGASAGTPSTLVVRRYTFPAIASPADRLDPTTVDALAGFPDAPVVTPTLDDVPRLLPADGVMGAGSAVRSEYADSPAQLHDYVQTWMGEGVGGPVLTIETNIGQGVGTSNGDPIELSPWDRATVPLMTPGYAGLLLEDPSGYVSLWSQGLTLDDLVAVAEGMALRPDGQPGWFTKNVPAGLTEIGGAWGTGVASRHVRWSSGGTAELWIARGVAGIYTTPLYLGTSTQFVDIGGVRGVAYDVDDRSAVIWSPEPDLVVMFALYGSVDDAVALARSVAPVDEATWLALTTPAPPGQDGCDSMFC